MLLYSGPVSLFTAKIRIALGEKGLAYERIEVGWSLADRYLPHHPEVVARNPKRQVPVLVDGELSLYDSTVILEYLEDAYPSPALYPAAPVARALCRQLEAAADEIIFPLVWDVIEEGLYPAAETGRDPARLERARKGLAEQYAALDARLADCDYLCGQLGVADIASFIMLSAGTTLGAPADAGLTHLHEWMARVAARPSVREEMVGMTAALAAARG